MVDLKAVGTVRPQSGKPESYMQKPMHYGHIKSPSRLDLTLMAPAVSKAGYGSMSAGEVRIRGTWYHPKTRLGRSEDPWTTRSRRCDMRSDGRVKRGCVPRVCRPFLKRYQNPNWCERVLI